MSIRTACSTRAAAAAVALAVAAPACAQSADSGPPEPPAAPDGGDTSPAGAFLTVPLSSCVPTTYTAAVTIGGSQTFQLTIDTGSTSLGVASSGCRQCSGVTPLYDPGSSAEDQHRQASSEYETGKWSGEIYEDDVATSGAQVPVRLVAIDEQSEFFVPTDCDSDSGSTQGILGLGPSVAAVNGTNGYLDQLVAAKVVPDVLAIWLCDTGGTMWLGGYDPAAVTRPPAYAAQLTDYGGFYYSVHMTSIGVGGTRVEMPSKYPDTVVDTGSSVFILARPAYQAVTQAIAASDGFKQVLGSMDATWFDDPTDCRPLGHTKAELDRILPPLALSLGDDGGVAVQATATESYLVPYKGDWCPALYAMDQGSRFPLAAVLGSPILRSSVVVFDRANARIGFAPHTPCP